MTVKDVFDLRRQGRIEEAYEAIRPMYAAHKGRYTTLCMFWTASDVFELRMDEGRTDEAEKIYRALQRMLPRVQEIERQLQEERGTIGEDSSDSASDFMEFARQCLDDKPSATELFTQNSSLSAVAREHDERTLEESPLVLLHASENDEEEAPQQVVDVRNISGLTPMQRIVLGFIAANPGSDLPSIAHGLGLPTQLVEPHLAALTATGLITQASNGYFAKQ